MRPPPPRRPVSPATGRTPLFVEREAYRGRRIRDAIRALPALGLLLWMVPLLWPIRGEPIRSSSALLYLFGVWLLMVVLARLLVLFLDRGDRKAARAARAAEAMAGESAGELDQKPGDAAAQERGP